MRQLMATLTAALILAALPGSASAGHSAAGRWHFASTLNQAPTRTASQTNTNSRANTRAHVQSSSSPAQALLELLNVERTSHGLKPLVMDTALSSLAEAKSEDMNNNHYFSHTSPTYGAPTQMLRQAGVRYTSFAENIAQGSSPLQIHTMWLNSAGHRANMMNPNFTNIGIGVVSGNSDLTATELFIAR